MSLSPELKRLLEPAEERERRYILDALSKASVGGLVFVLCPDGHMAKSIACKWASEIYHLAKIPVAPLEGFRSGFRIFNLEVRFISIADQPAMIRGHGPEMTHLFIHPECLFCRGHQLVQYRDWLEVASSRGILRA